MTPTTLCSLRRALCLRSPLLLAICCSAAFAAVEEDPALSVARLSDVRGTATATFLNMVPAGTGRQFAELEVAEHPEIWPALEQELAAVLRETFSLEQLRELQRFLSSATGQLWVKNSPALFERLQARSAAPESAIFQFASVGCVVGLLGPNIDAAKAKVGKTEPGIPAGVFEAIRPLRQAAKKTCDCIFAEAHKRWPSSTIPQLQLLPELQSFAS
ncbi:MAG: DUF2059 domain-containing protein [Thermoanaerobaculia bacterium]